MGFFSKTRSYLGVDLGTGSVKMVELANVAGQAKLVTYGFAELPVDEVKFEVHEVVERTSKVVQGIHQRAHMQGRRAVAALPTFAVFSSVLALPIMNEREVGQALTYEAKKILPLPVEEMNLNWKVLKPRAESPQMPGRRDKTMRVLLTAAPKNLVNQYLAIFRSCGFELLSLETEAFALGRALLGSEPGAAMLVDVGALTTDLVVVEDHVPILNRSIDVGGVTVTKAIAASLNVDKKRAEQFKRDVGLVAGVGGSGNVPKTIEVTLSPMINEVRYAISLYQAESAQPIEKIVLTGGSAYLPNLPQYLESIFQIRVVVGDPWSQVSYPLDLKGVLEEIGPRFATAIGLALREIHV